MPLSSLHLFPVWSHAPRLTDILNSCNGDAGSCERGFYKVQISEVVWPLCWECWMTWPHWKWFLSLSDRNICGGAEEESLTLFLWLLWEWPRTESNDILTLEKCWHCTFKNRMVKARQSCLFFPPKQLSENLWFIFSSSGVKWSWP